MNSNPNFENKLSIENLPPPDTKIDEIVSELHRQREEIIELFIKTFLVLHSTTEEELRHMFRNCHLQISQGLMIDGVMGTKIKIMLDEK